MWESKGSTNVLSFSVSICTTCTECLFKTFKKWTDIVISVEKQQCWHSVKDVYVPGYKDVYWSYNANKLAFARPVS